MKSEKVLNAFSSIGKIYIILVAIFGTITCIYLFYESVRNIISDVKYTSHDVESTNNSICTVIDGVPSCTTQIKQKDDLETTINTGSSVFFTDDKFKVYTRDGTNKIYMSEPERRTYWFVILTCIITILFLFTWLYATHKYEIAAVLTGIYGLINLAI